MTDLVNRPSHYTIGPKCACGRIIEAIDVTREHSFTRGNAIKYLWRAGLKGDQAKEVEDLRKAVWYINDEIARLTPVSTVSDIDRLRANGNTA